MGNQFQAKCINVCNPNVCCAYCFHENPRSQPVDDRGASIGPSVHGLGADDIVFDDQYLEKELANEVELWRMETSSAHDEFKIPFISDQTDDAGKLDAILSEPTSARSGRPGNMVLNNIASATRNTGTTAGVACRNQHWIGGLTNRDHFVEPGEVFVEESRANQDEMLSEDLRHTFAFLSSLTAETKVNSHATISRKVIDMDAAAAAAAAANKENSIDPNAVLTPSANCEKIITFEDLYDESNQSNECMSQHSFAGFVEDGAHLTEFPDSPGGRWFGLR